MNINFITMCGIIVCIALITVIGLYPLFRDAAGYVNEILNTTLHVEFSLIQGG